MTRKGRFGFGSDAFEIENAAPEEAVASAKRRPGPMAAAIRDAGRASKEMGIGVGVDELETLELAVAMKELHEAHLDLRLVSLDDIAMDHLSRDRRVMGEAELDELKTSIRDTGLANPIRLEEDDAGRLFLIQGTRRLACFRSLLAETGDSVYGRIPALISRMGDREAAYRKMVDENLVRENVPMADLAKLAMTYSDEAGVSVETAISVLFASVSKQKRSDIGAFARLIEELGDLLQHPGALTRNLCRSLLALIERGEGEQVRAALSSTAPRSSEDELALIEVGLTAKAGKGRAAPSSSSVRKLRLKSGSGFLDFAVTRKRIVIQGSKLEAASEEALRRIAEILADR